jgi:hypothetical protein
MIPRQLVPRRILSRIAQRRCILDLTRYSGAVLQCRRTVAVTEQLCSVSHIKRRYSQSAIDRSAGGDDLLPSEGGIDAAKAQYESILTSDKHPAQKSQVALSYMKEMYTRGFFNQVVGVFQDIRRQNLPVSVCSPFPFSQAFPYDSHFINIQSAQIGIAISCAIRLGASRPQLDDFLLSAPKPLPMPILRSIVNAYVQQQKPQHADFAVEELESRIVSGTDPSQLDDSLLALISFYKNVNQISKAVNLMTYATLGKA